MQVITYTLKDDQARSDQYYQDIAAFADDVLAEAETYATLPIAAFQSYAAGISGEIPRTWPERVFEFLTLGVLWQVYIGQALGLAEGGRYVLNGLVHLRQQFRALKPAIDRLRGILAALFLRSDGYHSGSQPPTLAQLERLLGWLAATGDFDQEVKRLALWHGFLKDLPPGEATANLTTALGFASWFAAHSEAALGRYTRNVERFLTETHPNYRWREDNIFCGRQRIEYHLNMLGTELLNRAFRELFLATTQKVVLVPPCMRYQPADQCQAQPTAFGARCAGCTPRCRVHQLTKLGEKHGFGVLILPDDLRVFSGRTASRMSQDATGVIGVSCALTNAPGGLQTRALGIPAQGLLLDYCGCPWHWHKDGFPTDINFGQLLYMLGIRENRFQHEPLHEPG